MGCSPGSWQALPCTVAGVIISNPPTDSNGYVVLQGTISGSSSDTYPADMDAYARANPSTAGWLTNCYVPSRNGRNATGDLSILWSGKSIPAAGYNGLGVICVPVYAGNSEADNYAYNNGNLNWYYNNGNGSANEPMNGGAVTTVGGTVWAYYKWFYVNGYNQPATPPAGSVPPSSLSVLLQSRVSAGTGDGYGSASPQVGLTALATASDVPFGEGATATFPVTNTVSYVLGRHLLQPTMGNNGIYAISLSGTVHTEVNNSIPYIAGNYPNIRNNGQTYVTAGGFISGGVKLDNRALAISSDIEPSFFKGTYDTQHATDRYQHVRQPLGNSVDSVVSLQNDPTTGQHFVAGHSYASNATGFNLPTYNWTISGDGKPDANTINNLNPRTSNPPYGLSSLPANLDFGTTWDPTKTKSNQIGVTVKDTNGANAADIYTVTWHGQLENYALVSYQKDVPELSGSLQPITVNASVPANLTIPGQEGQIDWGDVTQKAGLPVAVAGAGTGALLLIPEVASGPWGWVAVAAQTVAAGASYKLGTSSPDHPGKVPITGNADYNEYIADVNHQVTINTDPTAANDLMRFNPPLLAAQAQAAEVDPAHWTSDSYFMSCTAQWQGGWYTDIKSLQGDGYNANGYTGHVPGTTIEVNPSVHTTG